MTDHVTLSSSFKFVWLERLLNFLEKIAMYIEGKQCNSGLLSLLN